VVDTIKLPHGVDPELLLQLFLSRERMGSTAVGGGVAIPHARHPVVLGVDRPMLYLCFLSKPIDFGASNGEPVHTLFVLLSPTIKSHLRMLARVASLLHDERFRHVLAARKPSDEILAEARRAEARFEQDAPARHEER
jgi:nitrogen PTS system EIIA component